MFKTLVASLLVAAVAVPAAAQGGRKCAERDAILKVLMDRFGESRQSFGLSGTNTLIETFASEETGSWTIIATSPKGVTCIIAAGKSFEDVDGDLTPVKGELI